MSASDWFENQVLDLILNNVSIPGIGDATGIVGSTVAGNTYLALHTADPTDAGNQESSEATYTGYVRKALARDGTVWGAAVGGQSSNSVAIEFGAVTAGTETITHFSIGVDPSGAGNIIFHGALAQPFPVVPGSQPPNFQPGQLVVTAD